MDSANIDEWNRKKMSKHIQGVSGLGALFQTAHSQGDCLYK